MKSRSTLFSLVASLLLTLSASLAHGSGYACLSVDGDSRIDILMNASDAALPAASMLVLDPSVSPAKQLIARFTIDNGLLASEPFDVGHRFIATIDAKTPGSEHIGRRVGGTTLGSLSQIIFEIETLTVRHPVQIFSEGALYAGQATFVKKKGQTLKQDFDCALFLGQQPPPLFGH